SCGSGMRGDSVRAQDLQCSDALAESEPPVVHPDGNVDRHRPRLRREDPGNDWDVSARDGQMVTREPQLAQIRLMYNEGDANTPHGPRSPYPRTCRRMWRR